MLLYTFTYMDHIYTNVKLSMEKGVAHRILIKNKIQLDTYQQLTDAHLTDILNVHIKIMK